MLEGWLAGVLQEKLGSYLDLSKEQLRMGLWKGDLVLRNIQLKPVEIPDRPFRIVGGRLQKLTIHIPWQALSSKSAVLTVDELVVVIAFSGAITEEHREETRRRQLAQKRQLLASEDALLGSTGSVVRRSKGGAADESALAGSDGLPFKQRLLESIMANLVVQANRVSVVYEDSQSDPKQPFAFGIALRSLTIRSCAADWQSQFVSGDTPAHVTHKLVSVEGVNVHFNADSKPLDVAQHVAAGTELDVFDGWTECVLKPLDIQLRIRSHKPGASADGTPKSSVHLIMDAVDLRLSNEGIAGLIRIIGQLTDKQKWVEFLQFRPTVRPGLSGPERSQSKPATVVAWWHYALRGVLHNLRKSGGTNTAGLWKLTSDLILARSRYVKLYKRKATLVGKEFAAELAEMRGGISEGESRQLAELEDEIPTSHVLLFREIAHAELLFEKRVSKAALRAYKASKADAMGGGFKRLVSKAVMSEGEYQALKPTKPTWTSITAAQRVEVYQSIGLLDFDSRADNFNYWSVNSCVEVSITGSIWLASSPTEVAGARQDRGTECALARIDLDRLCARVTRRARFKTTEITVASVHVTDMTDSEGVRLFRPAPNVTGALDNRDLVSIAVETHLTDAQDDPERSHTWYANNANPLLPKITGKTNIEIQPFEMVAAPTFIRLLMKTKHAAASGGPRPMVPRGFSLDQLLNLHSNRAKAIIRDNLPTTRQTVVNLRGITFFFWEDFEVSSSPAMRAVLENVEMRGAGPPLEYRTPTLPHCGLQSNTVVPRTNLEPEPEPEPQMPTEGVPPTPTDKLSEDQVRRTLRQAASSGGGDNDAADERSCSDIPESPPALSRLLEYQLYKTVYITADSLSCWISFSKDPRERRREATCNEEKIIDHRQKLSVVFQQLRLENQHVDGKPVLHTLPNKRINVDIGELAVRMYPVQLRALYHIYQQSAFRLMKLMPGFFWNHPDRDLQVWKLSQPLSSWAQPRCGREPTRWPLKIFFELGVADFQITIRGYPDHMGDAPPNLLYVRLGHLLVNRMTDGIDEAVLKIGIDEVHAFMNDNLNDEDTPRRPGGWNGRKDCRHPFLSAWNQEVEHRSWEDMLMSFHMRQPVVSIIQTTWRSSDADVYRTVQKTTVQPFVEASLPCGDAFGTWCNKLLEAWHAVEIEEDLSELPSLYDYDRINSMNIHIPRIVLTVHMDSSGPREFRDEQTSCMTFNINKLHYTKEWDPPNLTYTRQVIRFEELSLWDFSRHAGTLNQGTHLYVDHALPTNSDGHCMLLISARESSISDDAFKEGFVVDLMKRVDRSKVFRNPYGTAPPYAWPQVPSIQSKRNQLRMSCLHAAVTSDFVDQVLWYISHLEAAVGPSSLLGPPPNSRIIPAEMDMVLDNIRLILPAAPTATTRAVMITACRFVMAGELSTQELSIIPVAVAIFAADLDLHSGPYSVLNPTHVQQIVAPIDCDLAVRMREDKPHRRILLGFLPTIDVVLSPQNAALLVITKQLFTCNPFLISRLDPDFVVPSKWDLAIDIAGMRVRLDRCGTGDIPLLRADLQQLAISRDFKTDVFTIQSIEILSALVPGSPVATIGGVDDDVTAVVIVTKKVAKPSTEVTLDAITMRVTHDFMCALLQFHDMGLPMLPSSTARLEYENVKAAACSGPGSHVHGHAWGTHRGSVVLASCPRPKLFLATSVALKDIRLTVVDLAQLRISDLAYTKSRPDDASNPTLVSKRISVQSVNVWSVAGMDFNMGTWFAPEQLSRVLEVAPGTQHEQGLQFEVNQVLLPRSCPWMAQQPVNSCGRPSVNYSLRVGTGVFYLQNEFLQLTFDFLDGFDGLVKDSKDQAARRAAVRKRVVDRSRIESPLAGDVTFRSPGLGLSHGPGRGAELDSSFRVEPHDSVDYTDEMRALVEIDVEVGSFQVSAPVGFQEVVRRSQRNLDSESIPERHCLLAAADNIYAIGSPKGEMQLGIEASIQSGFSGGSASVLRLAEKVMEPVVITATISFCDEDVGEHRSRVLRVDIPRIAFTVNERQYAIVLAAYDNLVASPMYTRRAATDSQQNKTRRALDVEIGVEAVTIDLVTAFTGEALWKFRCDAIDICHQDDYLLVHLGKISASTECTSSFSSDPVQFSLLNTEFCRCGDDATDTQVAPVYFCRISLTKMNQQPALNVHLGDVDFTVTPEFLKAVIEFINTTKQHYASLIKSKAEIEAALLAAANAPRKTDIVLTDDDVVTEDLTLTPNQRLFFKPSGANTEIKLTGNGFSLRFEGDQSESLDEEVDDVPVPAKYDVSSSPLLFVPEGVTLYLVDMVLENFHPHDVSLGDNAQVKGVVQMANPVTKVSLRGSRARNTSAFARRLTRRISVPEMASIPELESPLQSPVSPDRDDDRQGGMLLPLGSSSAAEDHISTKKAMLVLQVHSERVEMHILDSIFSEATPAILDSRRRGNRSSALLPRQDRSSDGASWRSLDHSSLPSEDGTATDDGHEHVDGEPRTTRGLNRLRSPGISKPKLSKLRFSQISSEFAAPISSSNRLTSYSTFDIGFQLSLRVKPIQHIEGMRTSQNLDPNKKSDISIKLEARDVVTTTTTRMEQDGTAISRAEILSPTGAIVDVCIEEDLETYEVNVTIEPVQVHVAFSTIQLGMLFARMYAAGLRVDAGKVGVAVSQKEMQKKDNKRSVRVSCPLFSGQLVDDSQTGSVFPLLQATVSDLDIATGIHRGKLDGDDAEEEYTKSMLTMRVSADSMNQALVEWEPIIEPCTFVVEAVVFIEPKTAAAFVGDTEVAISSTEALNVNITRNLLLAMQTAGDNWKAVLAGPRLAISNMETAYKLRNETSDSITLWLDKGSSEDQQGNKLATGQELAFSLATRGTITSGEHAKITVGIPGCKPQVIDMDRIGSQIYRFPTEFPFSTPTHRKQGQKPGHRRGRSSSISRSFITIACNLFLDGAIKVASLRAVLFVENDTNDPIQLTLKKPAAGFDEDMSAGAFFAIRPGGGLSIEAHTERIWIRPDSHFLWATVDVPPAPKDGVRTEQVQTVSRAINLAAGITCFATCAESTNGAVSLHIMPTLAIHNRLPRMMNARVYRYQNTGKTECMIPGQKMDKLTADRQAQAWEGSLLPGEASHHCFGSSADHLLLSIQIDGFSWSQPVIIESPVHFVSKTLELRDEKRRTLTLGLDNRMGTTEERCWRSVAVFCSCWIVNLTGLPLLYSGSSSGLVELAREGHTTAAGEPPDGNTSSQPVLIGWQRASFKVADTTAGAGTIATIGETAETVWSKPFSTTAIRTSGVTSVVEKETAKDVRIPSFVSLNSVATTHTLRRHACDFSKSVPFLDLCVHRQGQQAASRA